MDKQIPKRLGYWISEKKSKRISISDIEDALRDRNIEPVKVDLNVSLNSQGPFNGFLHKLTDVIAKADNGHKEAGIMLHNFETFLKLNPEVVQIDPIESIRNIIDRSKTYSLMDACDFETKETVFVPRFVVLESNKQNDNITSLQLHKVQFPLVCKPIMAHGSVSAHQMTLVFNETGLSDCTFPCVAQSFINHSAILYKLFCIGEESFMVERPSIKNLYPSQDSSPIHFHSDEISKPGASSDLTIQDLGEIECKQQCKPNPEVLKAIARGVHHKLQVGLYGVDVVVESTTGKYAIIDINVFPGYDGVKNFPERLANYIRTALDKSDESLDVQSNDCINNFNSEAYIQDRVWPTALADEG